MPSDDWYGKIDQWKAQMDIIVPQIQESVEKHSEAITALQTANVTEEQRTRKTVEAVLKNGEHRLRTILLVVAALASIGTTIYGVLK